MTLDFGEARTPAGTIVITGRRNAQPVQAQTVATNITAAQIENLPPNQYVDALAGLADALREMLEQFRN